MLRARQLTREAKENKQRSKSEKEDNEMLDLYREADIVYQDYCQHCKLSRLDQEELKTLVKFICKLEMKPNDAPSHHKNMSMMRTRLRQCDPSWENYFMPIVQEDEHVDTTTENDENIKNDARVQNEAS